MHTIKRTYAFADNWARHMFTSSSFHATYTHTHTMQTNRTEKFKKNNDENIQIISRSLWKIFYIARKVSFVREHRSYIFWIVAAIYQRTKEEPLHGDEQQQQQRQQPLVDGLIEIKSSLSVYYVLLLLIINNNNNNSSVDGNSGISRERCIVLHPHIYHQLYHQCYFI